MTFSAPSMRIGPIMGTSAPEAFNVVNWLSRFAAVASWVCVSTTVMSVPLMAKAKPEW